MTSTFDFLMVLYSIVIGISMSKILSAIGNVIQANKPIKLYWVHTAWVFFIFIMHIFVWFSGWQYATIKVWSIEGFVLFLTIPVCLFILSVITLPDIDPDRNYDMWDYYFKNSHWLHALVIAIIILSAINEYLLLDQFPLTPRNVGRGVAVLVLCAGWIFGNPKWHGFQVVVLYLTLGSFAFTYRESIGV